MNDELIQLSEVLKKRGFIVRLIENSGQVQDALGKILNESGETKSIGCGNSVTLRDLSLHDYFKKYSSELYIHSPIGTKETDKKALTADLYFTSANAISLDGHIVNIDGTGNRTAATCFGPKKVIYIIGKNKITKTLEDALNRAKVTAVELAKRYNRKTPCVKSGKCEDCNSPESICAVTTIHRKKPYGVNIIVMLINEDLGM